VHTEPTKQKHTCVDIRTITAETAD